MTRRPKRFLRLWARNVGLMVGLVVGFALSLLIALQLSLWLVGSDRLAVLIWLAEVTLIVSGITALVESRDP